MYNKELAKRFISDYKLPIPLINEKYFFYHLGLYQEDYNSLEYYFELVLIPPVFEPFKTTVPTSSSTYRSTPFAPSQQTTGASSSRICRNRSMRQMPTKSLTADCKMELANKRLNHNTYSYL